MLSDDFAISVTDIHKDYHIYDRPQDRLKQMLIPRVQRAVKFKPSQFYKNHSALEDISFDIHRGETIGIIGRNGSGKSTLLQIICGTLTPTSGSVKVGGRIAALLELGAGFNPEFTGRENVFMNSAILGMTRSDVEDRFDKIVEFADIGSFIDQPVRTYSSGMYVRLAFAVAINVDPDILIIDEALSVGDEAFQRKCFDRIEQIKSQGATILFVSHGAQTILQLCDRAILLDRGNILLDGKAKKVVSQYQRFVNLPISESERVRENILQMDGWEDEPAIVNPAEEVVPEIVVEVESPDPSWLDLSLTSSSRVDYEKHGVTISDIKITTLDGRKVNNLSTGETYIYQYVVNFTEDVEDVGFGMMIKTTQGVDLGGAATDFEKEKRLSYAKAGSQYQVSFSVDWTLNPGTYFLNAGVTGRTEKHTGYFHRVLDALLFKILPTEAATATGIVNFNSVPSYHLINAE